MATTHSGVFPSSYGHPAEAATFTYGPLKRLTDVSYVWGDSVAYGYDSVANRASGTTIVSDSDGDGLTDALEETLCTERADSDSDDDGIADGIEDENLNGVVDPGETDPCLIDSDGDGIQDGTELGYTLETADQDTDLAVFIPDADPASTNDPLNVDSDGDGMPDGEEDSNYNGKLDPGETDPGQPKFSGTGWLYLLLHDDGAVPADNGTSSQSMPNVILW